jgi:hypothetical protein
MPTIPSYPHDLFTDEILLDPHPHYRALRELGPLVRLDAYDMYILPRHAECAPRSAILTPSAPAGVAGTSAGPRRRRTTRVPQNLDGPAVAAARFGRPTERESCRRQKESIR